MLGSIFVGAGVLYLINIAETSVMCELREHEFSSDEIFVLYVLSFLGFGTKLSLWPF